MSALKNIHSLRYRIYLFSACDSFLKNDTGCDADINYFIQCPENPGGRLKDFYTLLIDLKKEEKEIWDGIYHRTQTEIRSFLNNSSFSHELRMDLSEKELKAFIEMYDAFATLKKIRKAEKQRLQAYREAGILGVSWIKSGENFLCINFYRCTTERAANLHSFHLKHSGNAELSASLYGKAHRSLHWLDMLEFKKRGVLIYDFCGWYEGSESKELLNINAFKEQFGGYKVKEYTGVIYNNKLLAALKKFI